MFNFFEYIYSKFFEPRKEIVYTPTILTRLSQLEQALKDEDDEAIETLICDLDVQFENSELNYPRFKIFWVAQTEKSLKYTILTDVIERCYLTFDMARKDESDIPILAKRLRESLDNNYEERIVYFSKQIASIINKNDLHLKYIDIAGTADVLQHDKQLRNEFLLSMLDRYERRTVYEKTREEERKEMKKNRIPNLVAKLEKALDEEDEDSIVKYCDEIDLALDEDAVFRYADSQLVGLDRLIYDLSGRKQVRNNVIKMMIDRYKERKNKYGSR
jgi:hypothetical protein